jgi:hypothetical protein
VPAADRRGQDGAVIRNAVLHINNEQPLLADLFEMPSATDQGLRCTNLRTMNGKRPVFADDTGSVFFFPYLHIRFVEIPPGSAGGEVPLPAPVGAALEGSAPEEALDDGELEIDEDFLRRIREV